MPVAERGERKEWLIDMYLVGDMADALQVDMNAVVPRITAGPGVQAAVRRLAVIIGWRSMQSLSSLGSQQTGLVLPCINRR